MAASQIDPMLQNAASVSFDAREFAVLNACKCGRDLCHRQPIETGKPILQRARAISTKTGPELNHTKW